MEIYIWLSFAMELAYEAAVGLVLVNLIPEPHWTVIPNLLIITGTIYTARSMIFYNIHELDWQTALNPIPHPSICDPQFWKVIEILCNF